MGKGQWRKYAFQHIDESSELLKIANSLNQMGLQKIDSLHLDEDLSIEDISKKAMALKMKATEPSV
jgi:hypothetical protein